MKFDPMIFTRANLYKRGEGGKLEPTDMELRESAIVTLTPEHLADLTYYLLVSGNPEDRIIDLLLLTHAKYRSILHRLERREYYFRFSPDTPVPFWKAVEIICLQRLSSDLQRQGNSSKSAELRFEILELLKKWNIIKTDDIKSDGKSMLDEIQDAVEEGKLVGIK